MTHPEFIDWLSGLLSERARGIGRPLLVAIDGPDAAGKTILADELAATLRASQGPKHGSVLRVSADNHLNPPEVRYRRGRLSAEGYCLDSVDYAALTARLRREPQGRHEGGDILLVDGIFLQAETLDGLWDFVVYLAAPPEICLARARERAEAEAAEGSGPADDAPDFEELYRTRYLPGHAYYRRTRQPEDRADLLVDYADPGHPAIRPLLYHELSSWWHLLSDPADYAEEAAFFHGLIQRHRPGKARTMLELGSGGGNNASHLKRHYELTLVDVAPGMIEASERINPECEHVVGDMRSVRLERTFDVVFVHDAIMYMLTEEDLGKVIATVRAHCLPGSVVLFGPNCTSETFEPSTKHGGHDAEERSLRYLEWNYRPSPGSNSIHTHFAYLLREGKEVRCLHDLHEVAAFPRGTWLRLLQDHGFQANSVIDSYKRELFFGMLP